MENITLYIIVFLTGFLFAWIIFYKMIKEIKKIIPKLEKELEDLKKRKDL